MTGFCPITIVAPHANHSVRRGCSSVGRARRSQCRGQGFDSPQLHHHPPARKRTDLVGADHLLPHMLTRFGLLVRVQFNARRQVTLDRYWGRSEGIDRRRVPKRSAAPIDGAAGLSSCPGDATTGLGELRRQLLSSSVVVSKREVRIRPRGVLTTTIPLLKSSATISLPRCFALIRFNRVVVRIS